MAKKRTKNKSKKTSSKKRKSTKKVLQPKILTQTFGQLRKTSCNGNDCIEKIIIMKNGVPIQTSVRRFQKPSVFLISSPQKETKRKGTKEIKKKSKKGKKGTKRKGPKRKERK